MLEFFRNFFTPKCFVCKKQETNDDPFVVIIASEAGIEGHKSCFEKSYKD